MLLSVYLWGVACADVSLPVGVVACADVSLPVGGGVC